MCRFEFPRGAAINRPSPPHIKSPAMVRYMKELFERGYMSGRVNKCRAEHAESAIIDAINKDGSPMFRKDEFLTEQQCRSYFRDCFGKAKKGTYIATCTKGFNALIFPYK